MAELTMLDIPKGLQKSNADRAAPSTSTGEPLQLEIADIVEDPDQPRFEFRHDEIKELAADIAERGVKTPVSVKRNPKGAPPWMLNYGARRIRASVVALKTTIPAFVDEQFDTYDQVAENQQRVGLSAMELAMFISKRIEKGEAKGDIARRLHIGTSSVSEHLVLLDMPELIEQAYRDGKASTARLIYDLCKAYGKHERLVTQYIKANEVLTRAALKTVIDKAAKPKANKKTKQPLIDGKAFRVVSVDLDVISVKLSGDIEPKRYRLTPVD